MIALFIKFEGEIRKGFGHPWSAALEIFEVYEIKELVENQLFEDLHERRFSATKNTNPKGKVAKI